MLRHQTQVDVVVWGFAGLISVSLLRTLSVSLPMTNNHTSSGIPDADVECLLCDDTSGGNSDTLT